MTTAHAADIQQLAIVKRIHFVTVIDEEFLNTLLKRTTDSSGAARYKQKICLLNPCSVVAQWSHHSLIQ